MENLSIARKYADHWRYIIRKRKWLCLWNEERAEIEYAQDNFMGPIYWCSQCIYGVCEIH